uniref:DAG1 domain-containing protein n=1 Tax=Panagrellus redivivus TaxID=6233 RepID=A0A7E4WCS1_PANRE
MFNNDALVIFLCVAFPIGLILIAVFAIYKLRSSYESRLHANIHRHLATMPRKKECDVLPPSDSTSSSNILSFKLLDRFYQQQLALPYKHERTEEYLRNLPELEVTGSSTHSSPPAYDEISLDSPPLPPPMIVITNPGALPPVYSPTPKAPNTESSPK